LDDGVADDAQADDPWFAPGPKLTASPDMPADYADGAVDASAGESSTGESAAAEGRQHDTDWFLRTGRAGLHPDSETSWDDSSADVPAEHHEVRITAAGAPPWAGETTAVSASAPPPWETGPWPGPGSLKSGRRPGRDQPASPSLRGEASLPGSSAPDGTGADAGPDRWPARTVLTAGLIPLVIPGLVLGFLSLRQAGSEAVRKASWVAIGASIAWAAIIIVIATSVGGSAAACAGYPAAVQQSYEKAISDLSSRAPVSARVADFERAASLANASAAATGQIGVRTALFSMADDMFAARADVAAGRPISATLQRHLADDGKAPSGSCAR
jgi:hypothetical protein